MIIKIYGPKALEIKPVIEKHLNKIVDNIKSFTSGNILDNLIIEICDPSSPDCPNDIKKTAGLTWFHLNLIQLNTTVFEYQEDYDKYYSNLLSHEFGHYWSNTLDFFNSNNYLKKIWEQLRGIHSTANTSSTELIAEDFRLFFGSDKAKGFERGNYLQANKVQGLKDLYFIWDRVNKIIKNFAWFDRITRVRVNYSNLDYNYIEVHIEYKNIFLWFNNYILVLNRNNVFSNN